MDMCIPKLLRNIVLLSAFFIGCNNPSNETLELKKKSAALQKEVDSLKKKIANEKSIKADSTSKADQPELKINDPVPEGDIRIGKHDFTLHWISWDEPGSVNIQPAEDGWYTIAGGQKNRKNSDYISINGLIKKVSASDLLFKGEIKSVVETNNSGKPCIKTGEQLFKITKNRKYWRLQNMINCEGGMLTDYVDIYF
ncbi:hypothetical protein WG906_15580 [Pedobacter sp. P351]|uniref:hypothetical protein n=1 Tax=Pedobacter superstes TaxID=3133441 RepID=UPI0030B6CED4